MKREKRAMINGATRSIMINKIGGASSTDAVNYRVSLPSGMVKELGVTREDRTVFLEYESDANVIIISKEPMTEEEKRKMLERRCGNNENLAGFQQLIKNIID